MCTELIECNYIVLSKHRVLFVLIKNFDFVRFITVIFVSVTHYSLFQAEVETFLLCVAVCHSVQVAPPREIQSEELEYQANSPDEKALVEAAQR